MEKRKYTKCQCCPHYAKDQKDGKWKCARMYIWSGSTRCIFGFDDTFEKCEKILERWIRANKE